MIITVLLVVLIVVIVKVINSNGVSTNGFTANYMFLTEGPFGYSREPTFIFPKVPGRTFFLNLSKLITFAVAPLVLTPFVRNQGAARAHRRGLRRLRGGPPSPWPIAINCDLTTILTQLYNCTAFS